MTSPERLKGIDAFVTAADCGSFTAAAARLKITNSAVGKAIARLEMRLGVRLFTRTTRTLSLTDAGATYYRTCSRILADLESAEATMAAEGLEPVGRLRIDVPASYGRLHVLPILLEFAAAYPGLRPHVSFSDHFVDLVEDEIDIVVRIGGPDVWPAALGHYHLGSETAIFCASPTYLSRAGSVHTVADLEDHDKVIYKKGDGAPSFWLFQDAPGAPSVRRVVDGRIALGDAASKVAAVVAGCGIAQLPTWLVQNELLSGTLVQVLPEHSATGLPFRLIWQKNKESFPKVMMLTEALKKLSSAFLPRSLD